MSLLFEPFDLRGVRLANRIAMAPMCQYSADRRPAARLASGAPRRPGGRRRRAGHLRGDRGASRRGGSARRTPASGPTRTSTPGGRSPRSSARRGGPGHPARPRRVQGVHLPAVGAGRGGVPDSDGGWEPVAPGRRAVRAVIPDAAGADDRPGSPGSSPPSSAAARRALRRRLRGDRAARRARLSAARVPVAADQQAHRRVRRRPAPDGPGCCWRSPRGPGRDRRATCRC